ncbi:MAG: stage II sporulation protein P, partial [Bacillota bacterium]|nr:stage II sporulation protein P [Bacillota bacterium]
MRRTRAYRRKNGSKGLLWMAGLWMAVAAAAWAWGGQGLSEKAEEAAGIGYLENAMPVVSRGLEESRESLSAETAQPPAGSAGFLQGMVELSFPGAGSGLTETTGEPEAPEGSLLSGDETSADGLPEGTEVAGAEEAATAESRGPEESSGDGGEEAAGEISPVPLVDSGGGTPRVLIYHTHATESYQPVSEGNFHSTGEAGTVREVGAVLAAELEARGIAVFHDKTLHDNPSYNQSYSRSMETLQSLLAQYPSVEIIIDLHRDAAAYSG